MTGDQHNSNAADIYCEVPTLYCLEVLQDKQEPLKIGRFLHSKKHFFASTTETFLCHAFTPCVVAPVVPKGIALLISFVGLVVLWSYETHPTPMFFGT